MWELGISKEAKLTRIMLSTDEGFTTQEEIFMVERGKVTLEMQKNSAIVLKYAK